MAEPVQTNDVYSRFCPGEERIKLSDAICLGRRRSNFPKCKGCPFNDGEKKAGSRYAPANRGSSSPPLFASPTSIVPAVASASESASAISGAAASGSATPLPPIVAVSEKKPEASRIETARLDTGRFEASRLDAAAGGHRIESIFGTNDLRGVYPYPLDADLAWRIGYGTAQFLRSQLRGYDRSERAKSTVVVGRDMRRSGPDLAQALIEGLRAAGSPVIDIGMIDTPQLYFAVNRLTCCGGIQVTASHNPPNYNGFKICGPKAKPISCDTGLTQICKIAQNTIRHISPQMAEFRQADMTEAYREFVRGFLCDVDGPYSSKRRFKVVVDASNGMAGKWLPLLFGDVEWLEMIRLNFEHNGEFAHDPNPLVEANLAQLRDRMSRSRADLGVCFDGDGDRLITLDEKGSMVPGDLLTALLARKFLAESAGSVVVYDLRSSRAVVEEIRSAGGIPRRERCGHAFIKKMLADSKGVFAGEVSGHYYFRDNFYCDSGMIAFAEVLNLLTQAGKPMSEWIAPLRKYASTGERNFTNDDPKGTIKRLAVQYSDGEIDYLDGITVQYADWWFNVRPGSTEPLLRLNLEAASEELLTQKLAELCPLLGTSVNH